ncbi:MAG: hypothetical protein ACREGE_01010 [Candidatus Microsaccharimonas sp.]
MFFIHPLMYSWITTGRLTPPKLLTIELPLSLVHARELRPLRGELHVEDILRHIDEHNQKEIEKTMLFSPSDDAPDVPKIFTEAAQYRLFRWIVIGTVATGISLMYGTGMLPM